MVDTWPIQGNPDAPIVVVCDPPTIAEWRAGAPLSNNTMNLFGKLATENGLTEHHFVFVSPCGPIPEIVEGSEAREKAHVDSFREQFDQAVGSLRPRLWLYMGKTAGYQVTGRPVKITRARGVPIVHARGLVFPMLSPKHVLKYPENMDFAITDFRSLGDFVRSDYDLSFTRQEEATTNNYEWRTDISDLLDAKPKFVSLDTEGTGLRWYMDNVVPLTVQISHRTGHAVVCPVHPGFWPFRHPRELIRIKHQLRQLCQDPEIKKTGHNKKFDHHIMRKLGIEVAGWEHDTQLLAWATDENMPEKSLDECVRRWVPEMAGYADEFNRTYDKSDMINVPKHDFLPYAAGDADASRRLCQRLARSVMGDERHYNRYRMVAMPAMEMFQNVTEPAGVMIDQEELTRFHGVLQERSTELFRDLIQQVPAAVRLRHDPHTTQPNGKPGKGMVFSRPDFTKDVLFSTEGFHLRPRVFTKSTQKLPPEQRVPSVSTKDHLPYFDDVPFVVQLIDYQKIDKLKNTYVGLRAAHGTEATGFWQYIGPDGCIHPSFMLHRTNTGRTNSADPNGQNFPKRSVLARAYRRIFRARPGYVFIEADLSQAELRIAAWMSGDPVMLEIYRQAGDIHTATACMIMGITPETFALLDPQTKKDKRQQAKAVNFGFLYGMGWRKFLAYAKTDYGVTFTEAEAQSIRELFFKKYRYLAPWHDNMREFVREHGYVRALHGLIRHLPNIDSNDELVRSSTERQSINAPVQVFASDLGLLGGIRFQRDADPAVARVILFIHDAIVLEVREERAMEMAQAIKFYMESPPLKNWFDLDAPLPIVSDVSMGRNLGEKNEENPHGMEELKTIQARAPSWYVPALDSMDQHHIHIRHS